MTYLSNPGKCVASVIELTDSIRDWLGDVDCLIYSWSGENITETLQGVERAKKGLDEQPAEIKDKLNKFKDDCTVSNWTIRELDRKLKNAFTAVSKTRNDWEDNGVIRYYPEIEMYHSGDIRPFVQWKAGSAYISSEKERVQMDLPERVGVINNAYIHKLMDEVVAGAQRDALYNLNDTMGRYA